MVKFMIKGDDKTTVRMCGHGYTGGVVYDNNFCRLPLEVIKPYIIGEIPVEVKKEAPNVLTESEVKALSKSEQIALLKEKGLTDKEIKLLSTERLRIERILLL